MVDVERAVAESERGQFMAHPVSTSWRLDDEVLYVARLAHRHHLVEDEPDKLRAAANEDGAPVHEAYIAPDWHRAGDHLSAGNDLVVLGNDKTNRKPSDGGSSTPPGAGLRMVTHRSPFNEVVPLWVIRRIGDPN